MTLPVDSTDAAAAPADGVAASTDTPTSPSTPIALPAAPRTIEVDLLCVNCAYNLRSLTTNLPCPECGIEIVKSLQVGGYAGARWPTRLRNGAICCAVAGIVLGISAMFVRRLGFTLSLFDLSFGVLITVGAALSASGWCLLTTPAPSAHSNSNRTWLRRPARICGVVSASVLFTYVTMLFVLTWVAPKLAQVKPVLDVVFVVLFASWGAAMAIRNICGGLYLKNLSIRLRWGMSELYCWVVVLCTIIATPIGTWMLIKLINSRRGLQLRTTKEELIWALGMCCILIGPLFYELMFITLALFLRRRHVLDFGIVDRDAAGQSSGTSR